MSSLFRIISRLHPRNVLLIAALTIVVPPLIPAYFLAKPLPGRFESPTPIYYHWGGMTLDGQVARCHICGAPAVATTLEFWTKTEGDKETLRASLYCAAHVPKYWVGPQGFWSEFIPLALTFVLFWIFILGLSGLAIYLKARH